MGYRYLGSLGALENTKPVGDEECVRLVQHFANAPATSLWKPGARVLDTANIPAGTAIATFAGTTARYKSDHGNHAALFMSVGPADQDGKPAYIVVLDQWKSRNIKARTIKRYSPDQAKAKGIADSDNAEAFYIIR